MLSISSLQNKIFSLTYYWVLSVPIFIFVIFVFYIANCLNVIDNENNFLYATLKVISRYQQQIIIIIFPVPFK